ncbi:MAG TPA: hypothetical protein VN838_12045, partial [Bradyrhizobium sp.]|nr:hypothetical protein [Bradyrhizobium sp.]
MPDVPDSEQPAGLPPRKKSNPSNTNRKSGMRKAKRALLMQAAADIAAKTREEASKPNGMLAVIDLPSLDDEEDETREHAYRPKPGGWVGVLPNSVPPKP